MMKQPQLIISAFEIIRTCFIKVAHTLNTPRTTPKVSPSLDMDSPEEQNSDRTSIELVSPFPQHIFLPEAPQHFDDDDDDDTIVPRLCLKPRTSFNSSTKDAQSPHDYCSVRTPDLITPVSDQCEHQWPMLRRCVAFSHDSEMEEDSNEDTESLVLSEDDASSPASGVPTPLYWEDSLAETSISTAQSCQGDEDEESLSGLKLFHREDIEKRRELACSSEVPSLFPADLLIPRIDHPDFHHHGDSSPFVRLPLRSTQGQHSEHGGIFRRGLKQKYESKSLSKNEDGGLELSPPSNEGSEFCLSPPPLKKQNCIKMFHRQPIVSSPKNHVLWIPPMA